jgi:hypothetical protein
MCPHPRHVILPSSTCIWGDQPGRKGCDLTLACRLSSNSAVISTHLHEDVVQRSQLLVRELLWLRIRQALISQLRDSSVYCPLCPFHLAHAGWTHRARSVH